MKALVAILLLAGFGSSCGAPAKVHIDPGRYVKTLKEGELERSYVLRIPKGYDDRTPVPLVVLLHGWTSNKEQIELYSQFGRKADEEKFVLVIPDATEGIGKNRGWNAGFLNLGAGGVDDVKFIGDLIDRSERDYAIDRDRVYVAGHSSGAMMTGAAAAKLSDKIAAIGVVSGTVGLERASLANPPAPVSAILFHGKVDNVVPYDSSTKAFVKSISAPESAKWWAEKDGCGPATETTKDNVTITLYKGGRQGTEVELVSISNGGHMWPLPLGPTHVAATDMMWDFFKAHPRRRSQ